MIILFLGIISIIVGMTQGCTTKTIYKYIPQTTLDKEQYVSDIFRAMFDDDSPWVRSINSYDRRKQEEINKYFISQA